MIGDVMGHGPDEAALGVHLRVAWRALLLADVADEEILPNLAKLLESEEPEHPRYVTACDVTISPGEVSLRVAGHPAPIICTDGVARYPRLAVGPPLGVDLPGGAKWPVATLPLPPGSSILLYTDGLLEAYQHDADPGSLGIDELVSAVTGALGEGAPASSWIASLLGAAPGESVDDTAAVVLTTRGPAAG